ncbi:MAG: ATP-binding protein, partial [Candidatus Neomarinimicrobiota bacterium]
QMWKNLISNAVKFSSQRKQAVISVSSTDEKNEVTYCIKDNGAGFNMKYSDKLFGVFERLHSEKEFEGTGIGLSFVKRIIDRHDGKVWAESKVDKGSSFYFTLPKTMERS